MAAVYSVRLSGLSLNELCGLMFILEESRGERIGRPAVTNKIYRQVKTQFNRHWKSDQQRTRRRRL